MNYISLCLEGSRTFEFEPSDRKDIMYNKIKLRVGYYKYYGVRTLLGLWLERKLRPYTEPSFMFNIAMYFDVHKHCYFEQNDCWCW